MLRTELVTAVIGGATIGGATIGGTTIGGTTVGGATIGGTTVGAGEDASAAVAAACKPVEVPSAYEPITPRVTRRSAPKESRTPRELLPSTLQGYRPMALRGESLA